MSPPATSALFAKPKSIWEVDPVSRWSGVPSDTDFPFTFTSKALDEILSGVFRYSEKVRTRFVRMM